MSVAGTSLKFRLKLVNFSVIAGMVAAYFLGTPISLVLIVGIGLLVLYTLLLLFKYKK